MILLGLGGNLHRQDQTSPVDTLTQALRSLEDRRIEVRLRSSWYRTRPVPDDGQPWYTNGVAAVTTDLSPEEVLRCLLEVERMLGRHRGRDLKNAPRTVDLDLLAYRDLVTGGESPDDLIVPHPRLHERAFVLVPLVEILPTWRHPVLRATAEELLAALPHDDGVERLGG